MNKLIRCVLSLIFVCMASCCLGACTANESKIFTDVTHLGSALKAVVYCDDETFSEFSKKATEILDEIDSEFGSNHSDSFVYRYNNAGCGERVEIGEPALSAYETALTAFTLTDGAYDPTVAALVDLWGFTPRFHQNYTPIEYYDREYGLDGSLPLPSEEYVEGFKILTDFGKIKKVEEDGKTYLIKPDVSVEIEGRTYTQRLDFGGLAKGLAVKKISQWCEERGIDRGYVSYGTSSVVLMKNKDGKEWDLKLTHPRDSGTYYEIPVRDIAASTSGDYERYYVTDGKRYSHIINGGTGRPIEDICSVTVIGCDPDLGDCLSTGLCVMGRDRAIEFACGKGKEKGKGIGISLDVNVVIAWQDGDSLKVFSTADGKITAGEKYEKQA